MSLSRNGRAACAYVELGWAVLALAPGGKEPLVPKWKGGHGVYDATTNLAKIERTWSRFPNANIGIACGEPSGFEVFDRDPRNGGDESTAQLEREYGPLPTSVESATGGGGGHLLLQRDVRVRSRKLRPGVDLLSSGKFIVAPPSIHPNGTPYRWKHRPGDVPIAPAPEWLIGLSLPPSLESVPLSPGVVGHSSSDVLDRARAYLGRTPGAISGQSGHDATFYVARALVVGFALDTSTALDLLVREFNPRCRPEWTKAELAHKVKQADTVEFGKPRGWLLNQTDDPPVAAPLQIRAKFEAKCRRCRQPFAEGTPIVWWKSWGSMHVACARAAAA
jgi:hypothetical protein